MRKVKFFLNEYFIFSAGGERRFSWQHQHQQEDSSVSGRGHQARKDSGIDVEQPSCCKANSSAEEVEIIFSGCHASNVL
jgi:hypothetical protein